MVVVILIYPTDSDKNYTTTTKFEYVVEVETNTLFIKSILIKESVLILRWQEKSIALIENKFG